MRFTVLLLLLSGVAIGGCATPFEPPANLGTSTLAKPDDSICPKGQKVYPTEVAGAYECRP